jgi:S-adenosylmethionine synthetase
MIYSQKYVVPPFEVVERKGLGHPDTLADGISEAISRALSRFYMDEFGQILHHNVDKVLIIAGRGNRGNGLITPMRPMTMEAIAGKNPVSHVGKIYNVLAQRIAGEAAELDGKKEAYVTLVSKIGSPVSQPMLRGVTISGDLQITPRMEAEVNSIVDRWLESSDKMVEEFVQGKLRLY